MGNCDIRCLESVMIDIELMKLQAELFDIFQERKRKISRFFFDESSVDI